MIVRLAYSKGDCVSDEAVPDGDLGAGMTCFIVGPIGDRLAPMGADARVRYEQSTLMWETVFEPASEVFGLTIVRADKIAEAGEIPEQIFTYLRDAEVVIVDLSGGNANVMYELGLRHSREMLTIQVGEHGWLPFDLNTIRTIQFNRTEAGLIEVRNALIEMLRNGLTGHGTPVTATRVLNTSEGHLSPDQVASASALSFISDDPTDETDDDEPGRLELLAKGEAAMGDLSTSLTELTRQMEEIGELATQSAPGLQAAESFAQRLTLTRQFADALSDPADRMSEHATRYLSQVIDIDSAIQIILAEFAEDPTQMQGTEVQEFLRSLLEMSEASERTALSMTEFLPIVRGLRQSSSQLKAPTRSIEASLNTVLKGSQIVVSWAASFRQLPAWEEPAGESSDSDEN